MKRLQLISRANKAFSLFLLIAISLSIVGVLWAAAPNPGHNFSTVSGGAAQGDILYGSAVDILSALAKDTNATRYLSNTGASNNPAWAQINLADGVSGDLPFANITQGSALSVLGVTGNATADVASLAAGSDHQVLRRSGTALAFGAIDLAQSAAVTGILPTANGGTGIAFFTVAGPTVARTFTFPDANTSILTDNTDVTVAQGGTGLSTLTANNVILGNGASSPSFVAPGTSGNILQSDGTTWANAGGGVLLGRQALTSGTTYTPTTGTTEALIRIWGGGGGGGGCSAVAGCAGGGGGAGGYAEYHLTGVTGTYAYTIGAAGTGVSGANGNAGGNSTFVNGGTTVTAFGGAGGAFVGGTAAIKFMLGGAGGVISTNGNVNGAGVPGTNGMTSTVNTVVMSGAGGSTSLGGGGLERSTTGVGNAAIANTGSGGGGAAATAGTANAGGSGAAGMIIITEFR